MTVEESLIEAVKIRPLIWNTKNENYKNTKLKNEAFLEIAKEFNTSVADIKKKWHSIRSAFSRELRLKNLYSNVGNEKRVWKHFNKLMFLKDQCENDLNSQEDEDGYTIQIVENDTMPNLIDSRSEILENGDQTSSNQQTDNRRIQTKRRKTNNSNNVNNLSTVSMITASASTNNTSQSNNFGQKTKALLINSDYYSKFNTLSEEEIFGRSIAASLKKFDPKTQEIVKLRLQEVIVQHLTESSD